MDETLKRLLDEMPERPPRSKLEPHAEVIRELRRKRRTYQEIAAFLREHLQLPVAPSTIHQFVKTRARQARQRDAGKVELPSAKPVSQSVSRVPASPPPEIARASPEAVRDHIRALKNRATVVEKERKKFEFDPEQPLVLNPEEKEK